MTVFGSISQPIGSFRVNKGVVNVISDSSQDFRVSWPDELGEHVKSSVNGASIKVVADVDAAQITLNIADVPECNVRLSSGNLIVDALAQSSSFYVNAGNLYAHIQKSATGQVSGKVEAGNLVNASDLTVAGGKLGSGIDLTVGLAGDLDAGHTAAFEVDTGNLTFGIDE